MSLASQRRVPHRQNVFTKSSTLRYMTILLALLVILAGTASAQGESSATDVSSTTPASSASSVAASAPSSATDSTVTPLLTTETVKQDGSSSLTTATLPTGVTTIDGQPPPTSSSSPHDPLLAIMPEFAFSMPAQIVAAGVDLALTSILTIQLIFTNRYHYPLSKRNYCLQSASTLLLLISLAVHLQTVLKELATQSHGWPYMFEYIAVQIPPQDGSWTTVQEAFYLVLRATTAFLIHLTHIQFLTLLFPSALEARLILWMLGPLALAASGMEFTALSSDDDVKTSDLGDAIRNICNSTLFLLYGCGILIWGFLVNRRRAWRTDGGTAAFGGGALGLAAINTMISFVEIAFDRLWWLPDICWTLTIWQSWLGFWWWVGAGMGIGEVEDRVEREQRKIKRREKARRKREREEKKALNGGGAGSAAVAVAANLGGTSSDAIKGGLRRIRQRLQGTDEQSMTQRSKDQSASASQQGEEDVVIRDGQHDAAGETLQSIAIDNGVDNENHTVAGSGSHSSDTNPTTSAGLGTASAHDGWLGAAAEFWEAHQPNFIRRRMRRLRLAHVAAARRAATEQTALREQVLSRQAAPQGPGLRTMVLENRNAPMSPTLGDHQRSNSAPASRRTSAIPENTVDMAKARADFKTRNTRNARVRSAGEDDWVDEDIAQQRAQTRGAERTSTGDSASRSDDDDNSSDVASHVAHNGEADEAPRDQRNRAVNPTEPQSWSFRGGLRSLRMRDHTTYD